MWNKTIIIIYKRSTYSNIKLSREYIVVESIQKPPNNVKYKRIWEWTFQHLIYSEIGNTSFICALYVEKFLNGLFSKLTGYLSEGISKITNYVINEFVFSWDNTQ